MPLDRSSHPLSPIHWNDLAVALARLCPAFRLDQVGAVALPCPLPHRQKWLDWVENGKDGDLDYLTRDPVGRADPTLKNPGARTLLVFGQRYTNGWPEDDRDPSAGGKAEACAPWTTRVSRYARGLDYHDVLLKDIKGLLQELKKIWPGLVAYPSTDTGPYLEREYAWLAGLGFLGRNHCLIHEKMGSGMFLGVALTNLEIEGLKERVGPVMEPLYSVVPRRRQFPEMAPLEMCGSCTRCLDACPTQALHPVEGLDAHRCLSTWTIEWQGQAPAHQDHLQGGILFGCDICQQVCPWNNRALDHVANLPAPPAEYQMRPEYSAFKLEDLAEISDDDFRGVFRKSPIWRTHPEGLRRNSRRVLENLKNRGTP